MFKQPASEMHPEPDEPNPYPNILFFFSYLFVILFSIYA
jgi:hypothetical protein